jgi:hypothetical protein
MRSPFYSLPTGLEVDCSLQSAEATNAAQFSLRKWTENRSRVLHELARKSFPGPPPGELHRTRQENFMPQSTHERVAELHDLAAHAHAAAAVAHGKGDHLTAHELSSEAHEHSMNAHKHSEQFIEEAEKQKKD